MRHTVVPPSTLVACSQLHENSSFPASLGFYTSRSSPGRSPRRATDATRLSMVLLSRLFAWHSRPGISSHTAISITLLPRNQACGNVCCWPTLLRQTLSLDYSL